mmetsp:Transcript_57270/g.150840  ORF Transcript_57270/g.150840 Transcript_57270/m.150840 type:complete len:214 (+) Transcript_57270:247-888(+)
MLYDVLSEGLVRFVEAVQMYKWYLLISIFRELDSKAFDLSKYLVHGTTGRPLLIFSLTQTRIDGMGFWISNLEANRIISNLFLITLYGYVTLRFQWEGTKMGLKIMFWLLRNLLRLNPHHLKTNVKYIQKIMLSRPLKLQMTKPNFKLITHPRKRHLQRSINKMRRNQGGNYRRLPLQHPKIFRQRKRRNRKQQMNLEITRGRRQRSSKNRIQ